MNTRRTLAALAVVVLLVTGCGSTSTTDAAAPPDNGDHAALADARIALHAADRINALWLRHLRLDLRTVDNFTGMAQAAVMDDYADIYVHLDRQKAVNAEQRQITRELGPLVAEYREHRDAAYGR